MNPATRIAALVADNPQQMTIAEYSAVAEELARRRGCKLLVFGCGNDSPLWAELNAGGFTLFVEDCPDWASRVEAKLPAGDQVEVVTHDYGTFVAQYAEDLDRIALGWSPPSLPPAVWRSAWDVILIDGPAGFRDDLPGRVVPIHAAAMLQKNPGWRVFVHDVDRPLESHACRLYLGEPSERLDRLAVFRG